MKPLYLLLLAVSMETDVKAEATLPYGITPLNGEIRILYRPGFESTCTERIESDPDQKPTESVKKLFLDPAGRLKFTATMDNVSIVADVNNDGSAIIRGSLRALSEDQTTNNFVNKIFKDLEKAFIDYSPIGKSLKQNSDLSASNLCEIFPGGSSSFFSTFKRKVSGVAQIHGRPSLILKSDIETTCTLDQIGKMAISGYSWESIDLQSGLNGDSGSHMRLKMSNIPDIDMKTVSSCVISDTAQTTATSIGRSLEARLTELKGLMEKGLITQEQYEQKRTDILKAL